MAKDRKESILVLVVGDSLVDAQHKLLCLLLDDSCHAPIESFPSPSSLSQATSAAAAAAAVPSLGPTSHASTPALPAHCKEAKHSTMSQQREWPLTCHSRTLNITAAMVGGSEYCNFAPPPSLSSLRLAVNLNISSPLDRAFVYIGCGLRLLHLGPQRKFNFPDPDGLYDILFLEKNLNATYSRYRAHFSDNSSTSDLQASKVSLISHLPHSICAQKYHHHYSVYASRWQQKEDQARLIEECVKLHEEQWMLLEQSGRLDSIYNGTRERQKAAFDATVSGEAREQQQQLRLVCEKAVFLDEGVRYLNDRIRSVAGRLDVVMVDGYDITRGRCNLTHDGRHYDSLVAVEVSSLLDIMEP